MKTLVNTMAKVAMALVVIGLSYQLIFVPSDAFKGWQDDATYEAAEQEQEQPAEEAPAEEAPAEEETHEDEAPAEETPAVEDEAPAAEEETPAVEEKQEEQPAAPAVITSETRKEPHEDYQEEQPADVQYGAPQTEGEVGSDIVVLAEQEAEGEVLSDIALTDDATEQTAKNFKLLIAGIGVAVVAVLGLITKAARA